MNLKSQTYIYKTQTHTHQLLFEAIINEMMRILLLLIFVSLSSTNEHWFVFDQNQFPGFYTPLFTLISSTKNFSFALSTYQGDVHALDK